MRTLILFIFLLAILVLVSAGARADKDPTDLTGHWILNEEDSDPLKAPDRDRGGSMSKGGGRGGGGRGGGGRGAGGQGGGAGPSAEERARLEERKNALSELVIYQKGFEVNVTDGLEISRMLITDGRDLDIWTGQGMARATAVWSGPTLVVRWTVEDESSEQVRRYSLDEGGEKLNVTATMSRPGGSATHSFSMVYDRKR